MEPWETYTVVCKGGLVEDEGVLSQGTVLEGTAKKLINYEPALEGGYERILGYSKYDSNAVTGATNAPVVGSFVALGGVFAARKNVAETSIDIFFSTGSGWGTKINSANQSTSSTRYRAAIYSLTQPVIVFCDGQGPALKYNGSTDTLINGTGAPSNPKYAELHQARLVLSGYSANASAVSLSAPNADTDFNGINGAIEFNVGDTVVGLKTFRDVLYIFCRNSIWRLIGNNSNNYQLEAVTRSIGCISGDTIQEVAGDLIFLAPDGFRSIAATERIGDIEVGLLSEAIQPTVRRDIIGTYGVDDFISMPIRKKAQYRVFPYVSGLGNSAAFGLLGKLSSGEAGLGYEWARLEGIYPYSGHSAYTGDDELAIFGHPTDGYVYKMESGNSFDGVDIPFVYRSPDLTFKDPTKRKVLHKLSVYTQVKGNIAVTVGAKFDFEQVGIPQPKTFTLTQTSGAAQYGTAVYGTDLYSALQFPIFKKNLVGSGFTTAFDFAGSSSNAPHRIDSYTIQYAIKGNR